MAIWWADKEDANTQHHVDDWASILEAVLTRGERTHPEPVLQDS